MSATRLAPEIPAELEIPRGQTRQWLAERHEEKRGRPPFVKQLDWMESVFRAVFMTKEAQAGGIVVDRTIPQMVRGMGLPVGKTVFETRQRYRNQIFRTLGYLRDMGLVEGAEEAPRDADGRGRCILVRIPAGVAQSVKAALYGVKRAVSPRISLQWLSVRKSREMASPPWGLKSTSTALADAHARNADPGGSAAPSGRTAASRGGVARPAAVQTAIDAWRECTSKPWKLSNRNAALIVRYTDQLDELVRPGYGAQWLAGQILDTFEPYVNHSDVLGYRPEDRDGPRDGGTPRSLALFVRLLRRHARRARRHARGENRAGHRSTFRLIGDRKVPDAAQSGDLERAPDTGCPRRREPAPDRTPRFR